jgi:hypothetical protein
MLTDTTNMATQDEQQAGDVLPANDLAAAEQAIETANAHLEAATAEYDRCVAERQPLLDRADASERNATELTQRREALLLDVARSGTEPPGELHALSEQISAAQDVARACRLAAGGHDAGIQDAADRVRLARAAVRAAEFRRAELVYEDEARSHQRRFVDDVAAAYRSWLTSSARFEAAHRSAFGRPSPLPSPTFRVARLLSVTLRELLGIEGAIVIDRRFPATAETRALAPAPQSER